MTPNRVTKRKKNRQNPDVLKRKKKRASSSLEVLELSMRQFKVFGEKIEKKKSQAICKRKNKGSLHTKYTKIISSIGNENFEAPFFD